jgi:hypothetical protein
MVRSPLSSNRSISPSFTGLWHLLLRPTVGFRLASDKGIEHDHRSVPYRAEVLTSQQLSREGNR